MNQTNNNTPAWTRQKELQDRFSHDVPDTTEIANIINNISYGNVNPHFQTMRARALIAMYYLTGCRASEITHCKFLKHRNVIKEKRMGLDGTRRIVYKLDEHRNPLFKEWIEEHDYKGLRKNDIEIKKIDNRLCMIVRTENRKNKHRTTKRLPVPIEFERNIAVFVYRYLKTLNDDDYLFPFSKRTAQRIINDTLGFNVHFLRHIRATHLITKYDFNEQMLVKYMGWSDSRPAKHYEELRSTDLFRQFYKNKG